MPRANRYFLPGQVWRVSHRYHATAVDKDRYLARCMVSVDLHMGRAGVVSHMVTGCIGFVCACFARARCVRVRT